MIIVIGSIIAKPEHRDEALRLSLEHVQRSRKEPGCVDHNVSVDCENDMRLVFVEYWEDMPALMKHFALDASQEFVAALSACVSAKPEMKIFDAKELQVS